MSEKQGIKAKCRIRGIEELGVGLSKEVSLESLIDTSGDVFSTESVFSILVGKIVDGIKYSYFKDDKLRGDTKYLSKILGKKNHVEVAKNIITEDIGLSLAHFIYVPYDIEDHPSNFATAKFEDEEDDTNNENLYLEIKFDCEEYSKYLYLRCNSDYGGEIRFFMSDPDEYLMPVVDNNMAGFRYEDEDSETIIANFFSKSGEIVELEFEFLGDLVRSISGVRYVRID
ncbi:MAG: hypothetical protein MJ245_04705 [Clostridia bacterium]|nr:hypothetical protein [Clostridia bacterium]